jgi:hypothetical protein
MNIYAIECVYHYPPPPSGPEIIAKFQSKRLANAYAARHQGEGGGRLRVIHSDCEESLEYVIHVVYGVPKSDSISFPIGVSFAYHAEAIAFVQRHALWNGGASRVVQLPLAEAVP